MDEQRELGNSNPIAKQAVRKSKEAVNIPVSCESGTLFRKGVAHEPSAYNEQ